MSAILRVLFFVMIASIAGWAQPLADECQQFVLVVPEDWNQYRARLQRYQKQNGIWQRVGPPVAAVLGRTGLAWGLGDSTPPAEGLRKKEGDNRSPAGIYQITQLWQRKGVAAPPATGFAVQHIQTDTVGVDDPNSRYYNRILRAGSVHEPDWESWEKMDISDYDRVLVVSHNLEHPVPGAGSCIFIHRWDGPNKPTSGCTAMSEKNLIELIGWLRPLSKPRLVQFPKEQADEWRRQQSIP